MACRRCVKCPTPFLQVAMIHEHKGKIMDARTTAPRSAAMFPRSVSHVHQVRQHGIGRHQHETRRRRHVDREDRKAAMLFRLSAMWRRASPFGTRHRRKSTTHRKLNLALAKLLPRFLILRPAKDLLFDFVWRGQFRVGPLLPRLGFRALAPFFSLCLCVNVFSLSLCLSYAISPRSMYRWHCFQMRQHRAASIPQHHPNVFSAPPARCAFPAVSYLRESPRFLQPPDWLFRDPGGSPFRVRRRLALIVPLPLTHRFWSSPESSELLRTDQP